MQSPLPFVILGGVMGSAITVVVMLSLRSAPPPPPPPPPAPRCDIAAIPVDAPAVDVRVPTPPGPPLEVMPEACDEVSCLLDNNARACCATFRKPNPVYVDGIPASLDRDMINNGVSPVKPAVVACGDKSSTKGTVKVHVKVGPAGNVIDVSAGDATDPALGNCVAAAMQRSHYAKTHNGGSFAYPFVF